MIFTFFNLFKLKVFFLSYVLADYLDYKSFFQSFEIKNPDYDFDTSFNEFHNN